MKKTLAKIIGVTIIMILLLQNSQVFATTKKELERQKQATKSEAEKQQAENNNKIDEAKEKKEEIANEKSETMKTVESLISKISDAETEVNDLNDKVKSLQTQISNKEKDIQQMEAEYTKQEELLDTRIVAIYERSQTSFLDVVLNASSMTDALSKYYAASELFESDKELIQSTKDQKAKIENEKTELENNKKDLDSSLAEQKTKVNELQSLKSEKQSYADKLTQDEKAVQKEIEELQADNKQIEADVKAAEKKFAAQIAELEKQNASNNSGKNNSSNSGKNNSSNSSNNNSSNSGGNTSSGSGYFIRPISGGSISANGYYPSSGKFHGAIDYAVSPGTTVMAAADGVVMSTADLTSSYGTNVVIRHANGTQTYYGHGTRGSICVRPGQIVKKGEKIMLSGSTGNSSGPHLHFEVRVSPYSYKYSATAYGQDSRVDPNRYM